MKKILSLILIITMIPIFAISSSADVIYNNPTINIVSPSSLLDALGVNTTQYTDGDLPISRAEFLTTIMQLFRLNVSTSNISFQFDDIEKGSLLANYIAVAIQLGIVSDGKTFEPDRTITTQEASKIAIVLLGYANDAIIKGGWPYGYMQMANKLRLFDDIDNAQSELSYSQALSMLENICEADMRIQVSTGDMNGYEVKNGENLLTTYYGLKKVSGVIGADSVTSLYDRDVTTQEGYITIDTVKYRIFGDYILGAYVDAYVKDDSTNQVVYINYDKNNFVTIRAEDFDFATDAKISVCTSSSHTDTYYLTSCPAILYNGVSSFGITQPSKIKIQSGYITLIDNNGDNKYDVISLKENRPMLVSAINIPDKIIYDKNSSPPLKLDKDTTYHIYIDGKEVDVDDIKEKMVADCYISEDKRLVNIQLSTKSTSGCINELDKSAKRMLIDNTWYDYTEYFANNYMQNIMLSEYADVSLDTYGKVIAFESTLSKSRYGYIIRGSLKGSLEPKVQLDICTQSGKRQIFELSDKVIIDDESLIAATEGFSLISAEQLIKYREDKDGKICSIDTMYSNTDRRLSRAPTTGFVESNASKTDNLIRYSFKNEDTTTTLYFKNNTIHPYFGLSASTPIFCVDKTLSLDDDLYCTVADRKMFSTDQKIEANTVRPYNVSTSGVADVLIIYTEAKTLSTNSTIALVKSFNPALMTDGTRAIKLSVLKASGGTWAFDNYYVTDSRVYSSLYGKDTSPEKGDLPLSGGDIIRFAADSNNIVTGIELDYDYSLSEKKSNFGGSFNTLLNYYAGYIYSTDVNNSMYMISVTDDINNISSSPNYCLYSYNNYYCYDSNTETIYPVNPESIKTYKNDNTDCDRIVFISRWATGQGMIIYR